MKLVISLHESLRHIGVIHIGTLRPTDPGYFDARIYVLNKQYENEFYTTRVRIGIEHIDFKALPMDNVFIIEGSNPAIEDWIPANPWMRFTEGDEQSQNEAAVYLWDGIKKNAVIYRSPHKPDLDKAKIEGDPFNQIQRILDQ